MTWSLPLHGGEGPSGASLVERIWHADPSSRVAGDMSGYGPRGYPGGGGPVTTCEYCLVRVTKKIVTRLVVPMVGPYVCENVPTG